MDLGFLERGLICLKVGGLALLIYLIFLNYPLKMNTLVSLRPNYFIFIGHLKIGGEGGGGNGGFERTP